MSKRLSIVWFRQDLRLHDNEALTDALRDNDVILPVYIFDERIFLGETRKYGFKKTDRFRAQFVIEAVQDLREQLRARGADLIVRVGKPEEILPEFTALSKSSWVYCNRERTKEEKDVQDALEQNLWATGREIRYARGKMLYYTADLPFPVPHTPDVFTHFRKEVERYVQVREPFPVPDRIPMGTTEIPVGDIPTLADLGHEEMEVDERSPIIWKGGETAALDRLNYYLWETDLVKDYKASRNGLIGGDYSTKFSAWLAQGCLSPKMIYWEIKDYEAERGSTDGTYWVIFELLWRDFFRFMGKKHGNLIFLKGGPKEEADPRWIEDYKLLDKWIKGETGVPFIDANMREMAATGFMSNRGRQNVASFLVKDLRVNWQMGAEYFESILIDYDVTSNWGNWNYLAGVGSDPREDRYFNIITQAHRYDADGAYVKLWCPELEALPAEYVHSPEQLTPSQQAEFGVKLGGNYPHPIINTSKWQKRRSRRR